MYVVYICALKIHIKNRLLSYCSGREHQEDIQFHFFKQSHMHQCIRLKHSRITSGKKCKKFVKSLFTKIFFAKKVQFAISLKG